MAKIRARGYLIAGVDQSTYRFGFFNPLNNHIEGFDIDMVRAVATAIFGNSNPGTVHFKAISDAQRIPDITNGTVDIVAHTMTITCERLQQIDFYSVYFDAAQRVLVLRTSTATSLDSLHGQKVCATTGSDSVDRIRQHKPAFGGIIVAPILSRTRPEMATVRPGILPAARPAAGRQAAVDTLPVPRVPSRVRVTAMRPLGETAAASLVAAKIVIGVGRGIGGPAALPAIVELARRLGAGIAATREVTDAGWLPKQHQVGLTGQAIAPRLYVALAISGAMEHVVGLRRAGTIVAVNKNPKAPIFRMADLGIVADYAALLPHLEAALRG